MTTVDDGLTVADVERQKLQKHFGRYDILFFLICTIVGVDTIASVAASGGEAFTWMMIFAVVFFIPQALLFAELGSALPQGGGAYYRRRRGFLQQRQRAADRGLVHRGAGVHLDVDRGRDHLVQRRQVAADSRCL